MLFFTADQHYGHRNIIKYCNRPFSSVEEMNEVIIERHNEIVGIHDEVIHAGDFTLNKQQYAEKIIKRLNGRHVFIRGSHDKWMNGSYHEMIVLRRTDCPVIVVCHYAMLVWPKSHFNSWLLFGHSHGKLNNKIEGKAYDVGVDNNDFYPISLEQIRKVMKSRPDNFNLVKGRRK